MQLDLIRLLAFVLPAYVANAAPVLFGGGTRIDFNKKLGGKRILGEGKTWRGLLAGIVFGTFTGFAIAVAGFSVGEIAFREKMVLAFLLSAGTMAGDLAGSFIKRRAAISQGSQHEFFDQLLFLGGALLFASAILAPTLEEIAVLVVATYILHKAFNWLAHRLKMKSVPW